MSIFDYRALSYAKDSEHPEQNQDAWRVVTEKNLAVIADGVSSAIFSAAWARILVDKVVTDTPDPTDPESYGEWLAACRKVWVDSVDISNLAWYQRPKLSTGAFTTLLWTRVEACTLSVEEEEQLKREEPQNARTLTPGAKLFCVSGYAVGDSCLFHVRNEQLLHVMPLTNSSQFEASPMVVGSANLGKDAMVNYQPILFIAQEGDWLILATDAVSLWALREYEQGATPLWDVFWNMSSEIWEQQLDAMRASGDMRYDDATLVLLRVGGMPETEKNVSVSDTADAEDFSCREENSLEISDFADVSNLTEGEAPADTDFCTELPYSEDEVYPTPDSNGTSTSMSPMSPADVTQISSAELQPDESPRSCDVTSEGSVINPENPGRHSSVRSVVKKVPDTVSVHPEESSSGTDPAQLHREMSRLRREAAIERRNKRLHPTPEEDQAEEPLSGVSDDTFNRWIQSSGELGHKISETVQRLSENTSRIAGDVGDRIGERVSRGMDRLGGMTISAAEAATPTVKKIWGSFLGIIGKKADDSPCSENEISEEEEESEIPVRQHVKNQRRYYTPSQDKKPPEDI